MIQTNPTETGSTWSNDNQQQQTWSDLHLR